MKRLVKTGVFMMLVLMILASQKNVAEAKAKVIHKKMTIDLNMDFSSFRYIPTKLQKYSKVKVCVKNRKVLKAKAKGRKYIVMKGRKGGKTTMTVSLYKKHRKVRVYRYRIKVIGKGQDGYKSQAKEAFDIQNRYRAEKGAKALTWSDELYRFALYRLKHSGYDRHKNLPTDMENFFGDTLVVNNISLGENMACGQTGAKEVMLSWKHSPGHYRNIKNKGYRCGAIARYKDIWCAVFYDGSPENLTRKQENASEMIFTVKRQDKSTGQYIGGATIGYYEENDRWNTSKRITVGESGRQIVLEIGKTYVFYEKTTPEGQNKAEKVTITVTKDTPKDIVLIDN